MKTLIALLLTCAAFCWAQEPQANQESQAPVVKRLQSVTWDLTTHKLVWTVEKGTIVDGEFVPGTKDKYEVSPDESFMAFAGEQRSFGEEEGDALRHLLDVLSLYCVESTVWWDHGAPDASPSSAPGVVTKPDKEQTKPVVQPDGKVVKVGQQNNTSPAANRRALLASRSF